MHFCGVDKREILYSSSNHYESRIGSYVNIYDYLRDFFVNTVHRPELCVIYVVNRHFISKWDPVLEAGAGWVLQTTWYPMYTDEIDSVKDPLPRTNFIPKLAFDMNELEIRYLADSVFQICKHIGSCDKSIDEITSFIKITRLYKETSSA